VTGRGTVRAAGWRLARLDRRLLSLAAHRRARRADRLMTTASGLANHSKLWVAVAAGLALTGRRRPRSAAAAGMLGIGIAATLVNGPLKFAWRRDRPSAVLHGGREPLLPLPRTFSFPSGHAASAAAFATGASVAMPAAAPALVPMAATVAYSRVHTGVHYPSDVVVGAAVGAGAGLIAAGVVRRMRESAIHRVHAPSLDVPLPRNAVVLTSSDAGSADGLDGALRAMKERGWSIDEVIAVEDADRLAERLRTGAPLLVVAAGGDGTVSAAANAMLDCGADSAVLAVVPLGTSNDVARSLGIPADALAVEDLLDHGRVCAVDAAAVEVDGAGPRAFVNAATVGFNVTFAQEATRPALRKRFGRFAYPVAAARALRDSAPFECTLEYDGQRETRSAVHVSVSNAPIFGGLLGMRVPGASMTDGRLDVTVVERLSPVQLGHAVADAFVGRHNPVHGVHTRRARVVRITAADRQEIALDGEVIGELPAGFEIRPAALRVLVPGR
jgi:undecaprenyl-diphosphatase